MAPERVEALFEEPESAPVDDSLKAAMAVVREYTSFEGEVAPLREALLRLCFTQSCAEGIDDVLAIAHHFNFINRVADAFDFSLPEQGEQRLASILDLAKRFLRLPRPKPFLSEDPALGQILPQEVLSGRHSLVQGPGSLPEATRAGIEAYCASLRGAQRSKLQLDPPIQALAQKIATSPYKIVDEDFQTLREHGYDDQEIFELVLCAAWGASSAALEVAYSILEAQRGPSDATGAKVLSADPAA